MNKWFVVLVSVIVLSLGAALFCGVRAENKETLEWRQYVADHHCKIKDRHDWAVTIWACDGFEVEHS